MNSKKEPANKSRAQRARGPPGGLARVGGGERQKGKSLDFAPVIALAARAIDPVTFKYWKWKWLKAHHNIKDIERLWSSGYDIGFPISQPGNR